MLDDIIGTDVLLNVGSRDANGDSLVEYKSCHVEYEIGLNPPEQQKLYKVRLRWVFDWSLALPAVRCYR